MSGALLREILLEEEGVAHDQRDDGEEQLLLRLSVKWNFCTPVSPVM